MKKLFSVLVLLGAIGCTSSQGPIYIRGFKSFNFVPMEGCVPEDDATVFLTNIGLLDVAGEDPDVRVYTELGGLAALEATTGQPPLLVGTRILASPGRDNARVERIVLRYASRPAIPGLTDTLVDTILTTFVLADATEARMTTPLFGPNAWQRLRDLPRNNSDEYQVTVSIEVQGTLQPSATPFRTEAVPFPIRRLIKSDVQGCMGNDTRLSRYLQPNLFCTYAGLGQRFTQAQCCNGMNNPAIAGCEP
jgi:hypothetical protein